MPAHEPAARPPEGLTPSRRRVLDILAAANRPLGAYDLIDLVGEATGKRPAPISIYRALDFLLERGLAHRLATRNAYVACGHAHAREATVVFLICERCGTVAEAHSGAVAEALDALAARAGFAPRTQAVEVAGLCRACAGATPVTG
ncbi:transcriptional repressor [Methylocella sp.]|uniref:transcriptional repressor n=1 Tax=Methylocella sp. TaxID=1978226 RepID=UPI003784BC33